MSRDRRGFALPGALSLLMVAGLIMSSVTVVAIYELRAGRNAVEAQQAAGAAEAGVAALRAARPEPGGGLNLAAELPGAASFSSEPVGPDGSLVARVTGVGPRGLGRRTLGVLLEIVVPAVDVPHALAVIGDLVLRQPPRVEDDPTCPAEFVVHGVASSSPESVDISRCEGCDSVTVGPLESGYVDALRAAVAGLLEAPDLVIPGGTVSGLRPSASDGQCATGDALNWGEAAASGVCGGYHPVVVSTDDLVLSNGEVGGILWVEGDLTIRPPFGFRGLLMVEGNLDIRSGDVRLVGVVVAGEARLGAGRAGSPPILVRSSCQVDFVLSSHARIVPIPTRSWLDLD